jgi:hypothetical protein
VKQRLGAGHALLLWKQQAAQSAVSGPFEDFTKLYGNCIAWSEPVAMPDAKYQYGCWVQ